MMKMNTKKLRMLTLLTVLVVGVVLISGCVEAPEEKAPTPTPQEEVTPTEEVRPEPGTVPAVHFSKLIPFLPDPPSGWVGEEPSGMMMTSDEWTWSTADRHYTKPDVRDEASIAIIDGAYLPVGPWMIWRGYFEYETTDGYLKSASFKGYQAWEEHSKTLGYTPAKGDYTVNNYILHVGINDRFMVSISVYDSDRDALYAFADRIDYSGIAALK
jgi:hypothetical protein